MTETTEILFNSPALRSLKRKQLQKLCKTHAIHANGKNSDLIDRLRQHAVTLPNDHPLSIAARSEEDAFPLIKPLEHHDDNDDNDDNDDEPASRPSEQWEIVMESIQEVDEPSTLRTVRTLQASGSGEFGTAASKSIKAFANSLGLKRTKSETSTLASKDSVIIPDHNDELVQTSIPYDTVQAATPPLSDHFTFDPTTAPHIRMSFDSNGDPLPGCTLRPGVQAPDNARLSLGPGSNEVTPPPPDSSQPTTTLRLVPSNSDDGLLRPDKPSEGFLTPKLKPFETTFDLVMSPGGPPTPGASGAPSAFWAPDPRPVDGIPGMYPKLTIDDLPPSPIKLDLGGTRNGETDNNPHMITLTVPTPGRKSLTPDPFIFGSPLPEHSVSNSQFKMAATSVLEEMNQRLGLSGVQGVGMDIVDKLKPGAHTLEDVERERRALSRRSSEEKRGVGGEITSKFEKVHRAEFEKMEGIDAVVRRKGLSGELREKGSVTELGVPPLVIGKKRKSDVLGGDKARKASVGGSAVRGKAALPGAFDDGDRDEVLEEAEERGGKKARMDYDGVKDDAMDVDKEEDPEEEEKKKVQIQKEKEKEREVIKRKLDMSRAKRRSSAGGPASAKRKSATRKSSIAGKQKQKPKFGFLASAKKFVTSMWGKKAKTTTTTTSVAADADAGDVKRKPSLARKKSTSGFAPSKSAAAPALAVSGGGGSGSISSGSRGEGAQGQEIKAPVAMATSSASSRTMAMAKSSMIPTAKIARPRVNSNASSRLFAPTASSLAKARKADEVPVVVPKSATAAAAAAVKTTTSVGPGLEKKKPSPLLLGTITNSPKVQGKMGGGRGVLAQTAASASRIRAKSPSGLPLWSPRSSAPLATDAASGKLAVGKPLNVNGVTGIPVLVSKKGEEGIGGGDGEREGMMDVDEVEEVEVKSSVVRQRTLTRKPRISRSKVVARLASQRAAVAATSASGSVSSRAVSNPATRRSEVPVSKSSAGGGFRPVSSSSGGLHEKRTRSSLGAVNRGRGSSSIATSSGVGPGSTPNKKGMGGERDRSVLDSARKRLRQSEVARRRSRISGASSVLGGG